MSDITVIPVLNIDASEYNVTQIFVHGVRYTNLQQYASFLQIADEKQSRDAHGIETVKFSDIVDKFSNSESDKYMSFKENSSGDFQGGY